MRIWKIVSGFWKIIPQPWRYSIVGTSSFVVSMTGVVWAASGHKWQEGGRGGAVATIVSLLTLCLRPDYGLRMYEHQKRHLDGLELSIGQLRQEVEAIVSWLRMNSKGQTRQNFAIFIASVIGTLFWGFGDLIAKKIMQVFF